MDAMSVVLMIQVFTAGIVLGNWYVIKKIMRRMDRPAPESPSPSPPPPVRCDHKGEALFLMTLQVKNNGVVTKHSYALMRCVKCGTNGLECAGMGERHYADDGALKGYTGDLILEVENWLMAGIPPNHAVPTKKFLEDWETNLHQKRLQELADPTKGGIN